ncbi:MAG: S9 family peptidase [Bacteroidales bacterium]|nr:S9 family peptidase [Bacteroidales bacterium]
MKKITLMFAALLISWSVWAQNKTFTVEQVSTYGLYPRNLYGVKWQNDENYSYVVEWSKIVTENVKTGQKTTIFNLKDANKALKEAGLPPLQYIADYEWYSNDAISFINNNTYIVYNIKSNKEVFSVKTDEKAKNIRPCKSNHSVAFTIDNNLYIANKGGKTAVTNDKDKGIVNGDSYVHRQEFGIDNGIFWSPKGNFMAFYRKDETMVADYPLVNIDTRIATEVPIKYPMAGETSEQVSLGVYDMASQKTIFLKTKHDDHYLTRITWDPSEKYIYIAELNRGQNHMKLNKYNAQTGDFVATLFEEKNPKWVEPEHDMIFLPNNAKQFLWYSERDGFNHLYLYDTNGKLIKQVTKGNWLVTDFLGFDLKGKNIFIQSTKESPLERHIYKVNIKSGKMIKLSAENGTHDALFNPAHRYFIDQYSSTKIPAKTDLVNAQAKLIRNVFTADNPLKDYKLGKMEIGTIKAADGKTDLYYRMIKPVDFDPNKKYPVIVYVYGGPHAQLITDTWMGGAGLWDNYMAQKGYIMFTVDNRGSANRGFEFESVIHRHLGQNEMADQMKGIEFLSKLPYVDMNRIGVDGWSFGGFMTTSLMVNHPETFKVGVGGGPVIDWKWYEVMYGERYMDTPQENPEGYKQSGLLDKAKNLKGHLLLIHGYNDPVVVPQHSLAFIKSCISAGVLVDYFLYPGHEHGVRGKDRIHLNKKITQYFDDYL